MFIGRTDAEVEAPILSPPDGKNWLVWKDPDAGKDCNWDKMISKYSIMESSVQLDIQDPIKKYHTCKKQGTKEFNIFKGHRGQKKPHILFSSYLFKP